MKDTIFTKFKSNEFLKRTLSVLVLAPITIWILFRGGILYNTLVFLVLFLFAFEWIKIVYKSQAIPDSAKYKWYIFCIIYVAIAAVSAIFLREETGNSIIWICGIVWITDIFAYLVGMIVGGPKILPKISPAKTWAGFFGAIIFSLILHYIACSVYFCKIGEFFARGSGCTFLFLFSSPFVILISIIAQIGDFLESAFKRHFQIKDSGKLIPGHGGIMDRVDGLFLVLILVATPIFYCYLLAQWISQYSPH